MRAAVVGVRLLSLFFLFGFVMCTLTVFLLRFPGTVLEPVWRMNPDARVAFTSMGWVAFILMAVVGSACLVASIGLAAKVEWGRRLAVAVLAANVLGDTVAAVIRHDPRTLIGLPIGGAMIWFLLSRQVRSIFEPAEAGAPPKPRHPAPA